MLSRRLLRVATPCWSRRLGGRFGFSFAFLFGAGIIDEMSEEVAKGGRFVIEDRGRGVGYLRRWPRGPEGSRRGDVCGEEGGGLNNFLRGRYSQ